MGERSRPQSLAGKTVLVTGATGGIGLATARQLAEAGAVVVLGARDPLRGQRFVDEISAAGGHAELLAIDLSSFPSVRQAAQRFQSSHPSLDALVNNAGVVVRRREVTADGHERTWQTNFLGAFLLTRLLLPALKKAREPRVVNVSSQAHRTGRIDWNDLELSRNYSGYRAYANSKLALILFTRELARRETAIASNALHPGVIATNIWKAAPPIFRPIFSLLLPPPAKGAESVVRLAAAPELAGVTGRYFDRFRESAPSPAAQNDADAARLWEAAQAATASANNNI